MKTDKEIKIVEVFYGTLLQAELVRSLLADAEIRAFIKDGIMGTLNPWHTSAGGAGSVAVSISNLDFDKAKQIVSEYEKNLQK